MMRTRTSSYVGYSEIHPPIVVNPNFDRKSPDRAGMYSDLIAEMDYRVGQILDALNEAGVENNTIVALSSDNGRDNSIAIGPAAGGPMAHGAAIFRTRLTRVPIELWQ